MSWNIQFISNPTYKISILCCQAGLNLKTKNQNIKLSPNIVNIIWNLKCCKNLICIGQLFKKLLKYWYANTLCIIGQWNYFTLFQNHTILSILTLFIYFQKLLAGFFCFKFLNADRIFCFINNILSLKY